MKPLSLITTAVMAVAAVATVAGTGLAMSPRPHSGDRPPPARPACFDPNFVQGFQPAGDNKIIVTESRNDMYELTLGGVCFGLDTTFAIGIRSRNGMSNVCGPFDADIVFRDMGGLDRRQACPITDVRKLTPDEVAKFTASPHKDGNAKSKETKQ